MARSMSRRNRPSPALQALAENAVDDSTEAPSKTALKKHAQVLQDLGLALSRLPVDRRAAVAMPDDLREAIETYLKTRSHEGKRRQLQFIGKLLRRADAAPLAAAVNDFATGRAADAGRLHAVERWRDELIADDAAITRWVAEHPQTDVQQLRNLIRSARRDAAGLELEQRQPKSYRDLFQLLKQLLDSADPA